MKKEKLLGQATILVTAQRIMDDAVAMITTNNIAIQRLENATFLKFDLYLLKLDKKVYDLQREILGTKALVGRLLKDYPPAQPKKIRVRK